MSKKIAKQSPKKSPKKVDKKPQKEGGLIRLPGIVSDLDGVLIKGESHQIPGAPAVLKKILAKHGKTGKQIPFTFLTNGGFRTEQSKAAKLNKVLFGDEKAGLVTEEHVIQSHTIFKDEKLLSRYQNKFVLVDCVAPNVIEIAANYGYKKLISLKELFALWPEVNPSVAQDL